MKDEFTRKERDLIGRAFSTLAELTTRVDHSMGARFDRAYREDRRQREPLATKALMLEAFLDGYQEKLITLADLYGYAEAMQACILFGARIVDAQKRYQTQYLTPEALGLMWSAVDAYRSAQTRRMEALG